jgi:hypothetical protein
MFNSALRKTPVTIISAPGDPLRDAINAVLVQLLSASELIKFNLTKVGEQSSFMIFSRLLERIETGKWTVQDSTLEFFRKMIVYQQASVILPLNAPYAPELMLDILPLCHWVRSLTFPHFEFAREDIDRLEQCPFLRYLSFTDGLSPALESFLLNSCTAFGCSFAHSEFSESFLELLNPRPFLGLEFRNAVATPPVSYFCNQFFTETRLMVLSLDVSRGLDLPQLVAQLPGISMLSLAYCDLDIAIVFRLLADLDFPNLRVLNLSGNSCQSPLQIPRVPPSLFSLSVNKIQWHDDRLCEFLAFLFANFDRGLRLSIAQAATDSWESVFKLFSRTKFSCLASLNWSENLLSPSLFSFFGKNQFLDSLILRGCFDSDETRSVQILTFGSYLLSGPSIRELNLRSTKSHRMDRYLNVICTSLECLPTLEILDLSGSHAGDPGIQSLATLITASPHLSQIDFDGLCPTSYESYLRLIDTVRQFPHLRANHPDRDIARFARVTDVSGLTAAFVVPSAEDRETPFHLFRAFPAPEFPQFLTAPQCDALASRQAWDPADREIWPLQLRPPALPAAPVATPQTPPPKSGRPRVVIAGVIPDPGGTPQSAGRLRPRKFAATRAPLISPADLIWGSRRDSPKRSARSSAAQPWWAAPDRRTAERSASGSPESCWRMPDLLDVRFGEEVWKAKSAQFAIDRLFEELRDSESTDTDTAGEFV